MSELLITTEGLSLDALELHDLDHDTIRLDHQVVEYVSRCRMYLELKINEGEDAYYGINTGFGSLCNVIISKEKLNDLQHNLIRSHAAGMGESVPPKIARLILLLKIQNLSYGYSGIRIQVLQRLVDLYNMGVAPLIFQQGSLGASGDLAPLAHLSLPLIGEGEVWFKGQRRPSKEVLKELDMEPIALAAKEGLALLNGTQFSTAYGVYAALQARKMIRKANQCAALSMEAFNCQLSPLDPDIHLIRKHSGQMECAAEIASFLKGSDLDVRKGKSVQDPYAFRCAPQVHGASLSALKHVEDILQHELYAVTDNPNVFPAADKILSGGNFHAQPIALALDYLAIALAEIANISERRTYQLLTGARNLPSYLIRDAGLHSGFMIAQYTAASIVSQNKQYCSPASVDSIVSSVGQEDHVSMAANAATKLFKVVENVWSVLGIEWMCACQAVDIMEYGIGPSLEEPKTEFRSKVSILTEDRVLHEDMKEAAAFLRYA